jgi:predicted RNA-binding protein YlxR (DUF448 family)
VARQQAREQADGQGDGPGRLCVVSRQSRPPSELIRFVVGPDSVLIPDLKHKLPGRGVWVTATAVAVGEAMRRKAFGRGLKVPVVVPPALVADIERLLERDALQALSFTKKAGEAVTGFAKVEKAIASGKAAAVLHARDAAPDGVRKLDQALKRHPSANGESAAVISSFAGADLDLALGGANVVHAALVAGPASMGFLARWRRLAYFRGVEPAAMAAQAPAARMDA